MKARRRRTPENQMGTLKQFAARQAGPRRCKAPARPFSRNSAASVPGDFVPISPGAHFSSATWQQERLQRLARICRCLDRGRANGKRLGKMLTRFAWIWKGRHYKCDPARSIRFRYSTLLRLYRAWRNGGRTPAALALHYRCGNQKVSATQATRLSKLCLAPETRSFSAAYRKLKAPGATESVYRYATPARLKAALAALLAHRRHEQVLERAARQLLEDASE